MEGIIVQSIGVFGMIAVAIIGGIATVQGARNEKAAKERERRRNERDELHTQLLLSQMEVSRAQTEASMLLLQHAKGEHLNGNVEACIDRLQAAEAAQDKVRDKIVVAA